MTALRAALHNAHTEVVRVLLDAGSDPNQALGEYGDNFPLRFAAPRGLTTVVELLLHHGADPNHTITTTAGTALTLASGQGLTHIVELLLDHGADPNGRPHDSAPLMAAAISGRPEIACILIDRGATYSAQALELAERNSPTDDSTRAEDYAVTISRLETAPPRSGTYRETMTEIDDLYRYAETGDLNQLTSLLAKGIAPDVHRERKETPLERALRGKHTSIVKALLNAGADPNQTIDEGYDLPLTYAVGAQSPDIVQALLDHGAAPNTPSRTNSMVALSIAVRMGDHTVIRALLDHGAAVPSDLIYSAIIRNDLTTVRILLDHGVTPTPIDLYWAATYYPDIAIVQLLLDHGTTPDPETLPTLDQLQPKAHAISPELEDLNNRIRQLLRSHPTNTTSV
jgi:ankyrin repeat protein